jgi:hypothetical protein
MREKYHKFRSQYGTDLIEAQKTNSNDVDNLISVNMTRKEFAYVLDVLKCFIFPEEIRDKLIDKKRKLSKAEKRCLLNVLNRQNLQEVKFEEVIT